MAEHYSEYFAPDPEWDALAAEKGFPQVMELPPPGPIEPADIDFGGAREYQEDCDSEWIPANPIGLVNYESRIIPTTVRDGAKISVKVSCPNASRLKDQPSNLPVLFVTHGGGYISGSHASEEAWLVRPLQKQFNLFVISVEYRLAPEHKFPTWIEDAWDVLVQLQRDSASFSAGLAAQCDLDRLILAGSSAGAGMSASLSQMCRDHGIRVFGVILNVPMVCHYEHFPSESPTSRSYLECNQGSLGSAQLATVWRTLVPESGDDPRISPLLGNLERLPPHLVFVAGRDPLRDEGIEYIKRLTAAEVPVRFHIYNGVPHNFGHHKELQATQKFIKDLASGLQDWFV